MTRIGDYELRIDAQGIVSSPSPVLSTGMTLRAIANVLASYRAK